MKKINIRNICLVSFSTVFLFSFAFAAIPASAQTASSTLKISLRASSTATRSESKAKNASSTAAASMSKLTTKAGTEISQRIDSLNTLLTRVQSMKKVSDSDKANIVSQIQTQITIMNNLKTKIEADTEVAAVKADLKSITENYRIYALIMPEIQIVAASDRVESLVSDFSTIVTKIQARIATAQSAGKDVTNLQATLTDLQSKVSNAQTQAQAAIIRVTALVPDQGDQTVMKSNTAALKQSRADIKVATSDFQIARKDAGNIIKALQTLKANQTTASTTIQ